MKLLAKKYFNKAYYQTFEENKALLVSHFGDEIVLFLYELGGFIEEQTKCNELVFDNFTGYNDRLGLEIRLDNESVGSLQIKMISFGMKEVCNTSKPKGVLDKRAIEVAKDFIKRTNLDIYERQLALCGFDMHNKKEVLIDTYEDYKKSGTQTLTGTIEEVIDAYVTHNDRMKYCNGSFWRFADKDVSIIYKMFLNLYEGDYFLDNAVRRGVTID